MRRGTHVCGQQRLLLCGSAALVALLVVGQGQAQGHAWGVGRGGARGGVRVRREEGVSVGSRQQTYLSTLWKYFGPILEHLVCTWYATNVKASGVVQPQTVCSLMGVSRGLPGRDAHV